MPTSEQKDKTDLLFTGRIIPERVTLQNMVVRGGENIFNNKKCTFDLVVTASTISCRLQSKEDVLLSSSLATIKNYTENTINSCMSVASFLKAFTPYILIDSCKNLLNHNHTVFGIEQPIFNIPRGREGFFMNLHNIPFDMLEGSPIDVIFKHTFNTNSLSLALSDFKDSMQNYNYTPFHCYRAIESLSNFFWDMHYKEYRKEILEKPQYKLKISELKKNIENIHSEIDKKNKNKCMRELWKHLNINNGSFKITKNIKKDADKLRHGQMVEVSWEERKNDMLITWAIIRRFICFLDNDKKALTGIACFPKVNTFQELIDEAESAYGEVLERGTSSADRN